MADWLPKGKPAWWNDLKRLMTQIQTYGIWGWFRRNAVRFVLGAIAGLVFDVAGIIRDAWTTVNGALRDAGETATGSVAFVGDYVLAPLDMLNHQLFAFALGSQFGPVEPVVIVGLYALEVAVLIRLAKPVLLGVGEAASGIPVLGGAINAGVTFAVRASDALFGFGRRTIGGIA